MIFPLVIGFIGCVLLLECAVMKQMIAASHRMIGD